MVQCPVLIYSYIYIIINLILAATEAVNGMCSNTLISFFAKVLPFLSLINHKTFFSCFFLFFFVAAEKALDNLAAVGYPEVVPPINEARITQTSNLH